MAPSDPSSLIIAESPGVGAGDVDASDFGAGWTVLSSYWPLFVLLAHLAPPEMTCWHLGKSGRKSRLAS